MANNPESIDLRRVEYIAQLFGLTARRIQQLTQDGVLPTVKASKGGRQYDLIPTVKRYVNYLQEKAQGKVKDENAADRERKKDEADIKYKQAKAKRAELELAELTGNMHRSEDVRDVITDLVFAVRGGLVALPGRLSVDCASASSPAECSELIRSEVYRLLSELSEYKYDPEIFLKRVREREGVGNIADDNGA